MGLEKCIKYKGKTYCWDSELKQIVEIVIKPVYPSDCPDVVIIDIMKLIEQEGKE